MTAPTTTTQARPAASPLARTLRFLLRAYRLPVLWFFLIMLALWLAAVVVASRFGPVTVSIAEFGRQGSTWFPFSMAVTLLVSYHAVHVAAGMTRRVLGVATLVHTLVLSVAIGLFVVATFALERVVYDAFGWEQVIIDAGWFPAAPGDLLAAAGWQVLLTTTAQVSGLLVTLVYLRFRAWRGTLALPLTGGPVFAVMALLSRGVEQDWLTVPVRITLSLAVVAVLAAAYLALLRRLELRPPRT